MAAAKHGPRPVMGALVFVIVAGLGIVSVLPGAGPAPVATAAVIAAPAASAESDGPDEPSADARIELPAVDAPRSDADPQAIRLDAEVRRAAVGSVREVFGAQSVAAQREALASAYRTQFIATPGFIGDDYPWAGMTWGQSSLNYTMGQCTDFVAWRLNRDVGSYGEPWALPWSVLTPNGGNARDWLGAWEAHGWVTSTEPVVGAVAWFGWGANHVAYVSAVHGDGTILIEEYNWDVTSGYGARTIPAASIPVYLYPPG